MTGKPGEILKIGAHTEEYRGMHIDNVVFTAPYNNTSHWAYMIERTGCLEEPEFRIGGYSPGTSLDKSIDLIMVEDPVIYASLKGLFDKLDACAKGHTPIGSDITDYVVKCLEPVRRDRLNLSYMPQIY